MKWFIEAANKLKEQGVDEVSVVSETITTHEYESKTLAKAFTEITGIKVHHDLIQEGDVVEKLQTSMQSGKSIYDGWISDSDRSEEHTSELQSLMRISYAVFCLKKKKKTQILSLYVRSDTPADRTIQDTKQTTHSTIDIH